MLNKVMLIGNVGNKPEVKTLPNGNKVANFSLATSEYWKDKSSGEKKSKTEWHKIVVFNDGLIKLVDNYINKGSKLYIEGSLKNNKYVDSSGVEKFITQIVLQNYADTIQILDSRKDNEDKKETHSVGTEEDLTDDDMPF